MDLMPNRIREWRERRGYSLQELAAQIGCHHTFLGRVERGERRLRDSMIAKAAKALGVSPNEIIKPEDQADVERTIARMARLLKDMGPDERQMTLELAETIVARRSRNAS